MEARRTMQRRSNAGQQNSKAPNKQSKAGQEEIVFARLRPYDKEAGQTHKSITLARVGITFEQGVWVRIPPKLRDYLDEQYGDYKPHAKLYDVGTKSEVQAILKRERAEAERRRRLEASKRGEVRRSADVERQGLFGQKVPDSYFDETNDEDLGMIDTTEETDFWEDAAQEMKEIGLLDEEQEDALSGMSRVETSEDPMSKALEDEETSSEDEETSDASGEESAQSTGEGEDSPEEAAFDEAFGDLEKELSSSEASKPSKPNGRKSRKTGSK